MKELICWFFGHKDTSDTFSLEIVLSCRRCGTFFGLQEGLFERL